MIGSLCLNMVPKFPHGSELLAFQPITRPTVKPRTSFSSSTSLPAAAQPRAAHRLCTHIGFPIGFSVRKPMEIHRKPMKNLEQT